MGRELWAATGAVRMAPVGDVTTFVELVRGLRDDPAERARLGRWAQEVYQDRLDLRHTVSQLRSADRGSKAQDRQT